VDECKPLPPNHDAPPSTVKRRMSARNVGTIGDHGWNTRL
jgi:hypothetical protein